MANRLEVRPDRDAPLSPRQLAEWFRRYPHLPIIVSEDGLRETVAVGPRKGVPAVTCGGPPDFEPGNVG